MTISKITSRKRQKMMLQCLQILLLRRLPMGKLPRKRRSDQLIDKLKTVELYGSQQVRH